MSTLPQARQHAIPCSGRRKKITSSKSSSISTTRLRTSPDRHQSSSFWTSLRTTRKMSQMRWPSPLTHSGCMSSRRRTTNALWSLGSTTLTGWFHCRRLSRTWSTSLCACGALCCECHPSKCLSKVLCSSAMTARCIFRLYLWMASGRRLIAAFQLTAGLEFSIQRSIQRRLRSFSGSGCRR